jgi:hypothetical protein
VYSRDTGRGNSRGGGATRGIAPRARACPAHARRGYARAPPRAPPPPPCRRAAVRVSCGGGARRRREAGGGRPEVGAGGVMPREEREAAARDRCENPHEAVEARWLHLPRMVQARKHDRRVRHVQVCSPARAARRRRPDVRVRPEVVDLPAPPRPRAASARAGGERVAWTGNSYEPKPSGGSSAARAVGARRQGGGGPGRRRGGGGGRGARRRRARAPGGPPGRDTRRVRLVRGEGRGVST